MVATVFGYIALLSINHQLVIYNLENADSKTYFNINY